MTICILDTSVFCNMLDVPAFNQDRADTFSTLERYLEAGHTLLLPLAAVYETGNHIVHVGNGDARRKAAQRFVEQVTQAIAGQAPWTPTSFPDPKQLTEWLAEFPDCAMRETGLRTLRSSRSSSASVHCTGCGGCLSGPATTTSGATIARSSRNLTA